MTDDLPDAVASPAPLLPVEAGAGPLPSAPAADLALAGDAPATVLMGAWPGAGGSGDWSALLHAGGAQVHGLVAAGGPVVVVLGGLSVVALAILLLKLWQFAMLRLGVIAPVAAALAAWYRRDAVAALAAVAHSRQPVAQLLHLALSGLVRRETDLGLLREELARVATAQMESLRSYLRALEVIGTLSPLLGLLGTVLGMIEAFRQMQAAGAQVDPALLAGGIWQALLTTAVGLIVAIPAVLAHGWLERRVERCGHQMEDAVTRALTRDLVLGLAPGAPVPDPDMADLHLNTGHSPEIPTASRSSLL